MIRIGFIIHAAKKISGNASNLINECSNNPELTAETFYTSRPKGATDIAYECSKHGFDVLVAVGGDGTINEIVNGLMRHQGKKPALAVIPIGSGNDYIKSAGLKCEYQFFIESILRKNYRPVDIGVISNKAEKLYFVNIADIGFGGAVIDNLETQRKKGKKASYAISILRTFISFTKPKLKIRSESRLIEGSVFMIAVCIGNTFGNGLVINPESQIDDANLNITYIGNVRLLDYLRNLLKLKKGRKIKHPQVQYWTCKEVSIECLRGSAYGEMDGELIDSQKIVIEVIPGCLNLLDY